MPAEGGRNTIGVHDVDDNASALDDDVFSDDIQRTHRHPGRSFEEIAGGVAILVPLVVAVARYRVRGILRNIKRLERSRIGPRRVKTLIHDQDRLVRYYRVDQLPRRTDRSKRCREKAIAEQ
jgi:hypothetical protein